MIEATGIHKYYGALHVLKGVDLQVARGEIVSIIGKSGAGKSTLLHILGTLDQADAGRVVIDGAQVSGLSARALSRFRNEQVGFIFQFHQLLPEFTAIENVCLPALIHGTPERKARTRAMELMEYLGLSDRLQHKPGQLSGGEQQRVAVARSLVNRPAVVLADEPSGNLDSASSADLHRLIFRLRDDFRQTFLIVTHNQELANMSDRILEMQDGTLHIEQATR